MPRPRRPGWSKVTITISDEVGREIRVRAAELGVDMGTFVDQAIRDREGCFSPSSHLELDQVETPNRRRGSHKDPTLPPAPVARKVQTIRRARIGGGAPDRIAEFVFQNAILNQDTKLFSPVDSARITLRQGRHSMSAALFKGIIAHAVRSSQLVLGDKSDQKSIKFLDALVQCTQHFYQQFEQAFPLDGERQALLTPITAAALGIILGERLALLFETGTSEMIAIEIATGVMRMVKKWHRYNENAAEMLKVTPVDTLVAHLRMYEQPSKHAFADGHFLSP